MPVPRVCRSVAWSSRLPLDTLTFRSRRSVKCLDSKEKRRCWPVLSAALVLKNFEPDTSPLAGGVIASTACAVQRYVLPLVSTAVGIVHGLSEPLATVAPDPVAT